MNYFDFEPDSFDSQDRSDPAVLEHILSYVDALQDKLDKATSELDILRFQEAELTAGLRRVHHELEVARRFQRDLMPSQLPNSDKLKFSVLYEPAKQLSGDLYDVARINEEQIIINLSDCTGHGVAAAMFGVFINQTLRARTASHIRQMQPLQPKELLDKLNHDLLDTQLTDCQFVTSLHAIFNEASRELTWARGGMPYPILIRPSQPPQQLVTEGGLIGAIREQQYEQIITRIEPGDVMMFYTDGLEALLLQSPEGKSYNSIIQTPWCQQLRSDNIEASLAAITELLKNTPPESWPVDDISILAMTGE